MFVQSRINPTIEVYLDQTYQAPDGTVHERNFFNRTEIQQKVGDCLKSKQTPLALIWAARRSGKSSIIRRMAHQLCERPGSSYVHARITQGEAIGITTAVSFAMQIIIAVSHAFDQPKPLEMGSQTTLSKEWFFQELES